MSASVNFASTPRLGTGRLTANSTTPATPTVVAIFAAGSSGSRIHRIDVNAVTTTTANTVYLHVSSNASNYYLIGSVDVDLITMAAGTPPFSGSLHYPEGLPLPIGYTLYASAHAASGAGEMFDVVAHGGDF